MNLRFICTWVVFSLFLGCAFSINPKTTDEIAFDRSNISDFDTTHDNQDQKINDYSKLPCRYAPGLSLGSRARELECCRRAKRTYEFFWAGRSLPLSRYLEKLRGWNCPQFQIECEERLFRFNAFTELMYDYFCNYTKFVKKCLPNVKQTIQPLQSLGKKSIVQNRVASSTALLNVQGSPHFGIVNYNNRSIITEWRELLGQIKTNKMTTEELLQPCIQVAQYDQEGIHDGGYQEIIDFGIPSCKIAWCGFGAEVMHARQVSVWTCLTSP